MTQGQKMEFHVVKVSDIVEFPTKLGNRCLLLSKLGFNAYWNTEEEILDDSWPHTRDFSRELGQFFNN